MINLHDLSPEQHRFFAALPQGQFIVWKFEDDPNGGKPRKVPCNRYGKRVNAHDPQNWLTFEQLSQILVMPSHIRPGFVLSENDQFFCLDLDDVRDPETGALSPEAQDIVNKFPGAGSEVSVSGTGIHIIATCNVAKLGDRLNKWADGMCEWYSQKRYIAFGTNQRGDPTLDCTEQLDALVPKRAIGPTSLVREKPTEIITPEEAHPALDWDGPTDDDELIKMMMASRGSFKAVFGYKATFTELWNADLDALSKHFPAADGNRYCDWSSADMSLFSHLAFWTGKDIPRMIRLYQMSPLAEARGEKSDRGDYLLRTARAAAASCTSVYGAGNSSYDRNSDVVIHGGISDHELALILYDRHWAENARWITDQGKWMFWDDKRWSIDDSKQRHLQLVREQLSALAATSGDVRFAQKLKSKRKIDEIASLMKSNPGATLQSEDLDRDAFLLGIPSGVVDLRTGELRDTRRSDYITKSTAVDPSPKGVIPNFWIEFLNQIMDGDENAILYLQRIAGYALTGSTKEHAMFFALGSGQNGKSTFLNTLIYVQGPYAAQAQSDLFLQKLGTDHPTGLAALSGKRLVRASELPVGRTWNDTLLKQITGGDPVTARFMRQDDFSYVPQFTLIIDANNAPSFVGIDDAMRRRFKVIPFDVTIPASKVDRSLPDRLKAEAPEILRWCIDGAVEWLAGGLCEPAKSTEATAEYFEAEDTLGGFISGKYVVDTNGRIATGEFRTAFWAYLDENGYTRWKANTLGKEMNKRGYKPVKVNGSRYYLGLRDKNERLRMPTGWPSMPK
jgi:P4 family phage/plasmid primase-like protien